MDVKEKLLFSSFRQPCMHFTTVTMHSLLAVFWVFPQNAIYWNLSKWSTPSLKQRAQNWARFFSSLLSCWDLSTIQFTYKSGNVQIIFGIISFGGHLKYISVFLSWAQVLIPTAVWIKTRITELNPPAGSQDDLHQHWLLTVQCVMYIWATGTSHVGRKYLSLRY